MMLKRRKLLVYFSAGTLLSVMPALRANSGTPSRGSSSLWSDSFANKEWMDKWHLREHGDWGLSNARRISDPSGRFSKILRVSYPANSASPTVTRASGAPVGGAQFYADLGLPPRDSLYLRYYVKFASNFSFVKGGKLPGLFGGRVNNGRKIPDGTNGFSTRFMWRRQGDGEVYAYLPTSEERGSSLGRGNWRFQPNRWYRLEQAVVLNKPNVKDGVIRVWVDGKLVLSENDLLFRTTSDLKIEGIFFSTFFGGNDRTWATPSSTYADFADFAVSANIPQ
ncbi:polysaccharide lyase [Leptolyngbya sp. FACHB-261]|uniref:polysaccharide lyase n=1 Tax=Leptolyngbya sp. FACHB-261 TaxID=2692806 RepID=UPI0016825E8B|nr:hypothetical protein [Leptolyngbya sp. FACHB-261]MBD2104721.1 hypothetical protein [Leptolyngbya sp. FACHB-261]